MGDFRSNKEDVRVKCYLEQQSLEQQLEHASQQ